MCMCEHEYEYTIMHTSRLRGQLLEAGSLHGGKSLLRPMWWLHQASRPGGSKVILNSPSHLTTGVLGVQMCATTSGFSPWVPGIEPRLSDLYSKCFYLLSHFRGPVIFCLFV